MFRFPSWLVIAAATASSAGALASSADRLDVQLSAGNAFFAGDGDVEVQVTVTNNTGHAVSVARWQLPSGRLQSPLLRIIDQDGRAVPYTGPMVKRAAPTAADIVTLQAGESRTYSVELTAAYALRNGRYSVEYAGRGRREDDATVESTAPLTMWTSGRTEAPDLAPAQALAADPEAAATAAGSLGYSGNCSASQKSKIADAVSSAKKYATAAASYLDASPHSTPRFVKWFGAFGSSHWNTAHKHFVREVTAFTTKALVVDCSCTDTGTYAYVYPDSPYKIYVCGAFWAAPNTGTDSRAGTLVHEMSHFTVVAGTDDWAYGQSAAASLAQSNPAHALDNADSHEYFAENKPALR